MSSIEPAKLKQLLGRHFVYRGISCRVIEVLDDESALVLQDCADPRSIQINQYGEPSRRAPRVFTVPLFNIRGDDFNPALPGIAELLS